MFFRYGNVQLPVLPAIRCQYEIGALTPVYWSAPPHLVYREWYFAPSDWVNKVLVRIIHGLGASCAGRTAQAVR